MIKEFILYGPNGANGEKPIQTIFCRTRQQAAEKIKFLYPLEWFAIRVEEGRKFKTLTHMLEVREEEKKNIKN